MKKKEIRLLRETLELLLRNYPENDRTFTRAWQDIVEQYTGIPSHQQRGFNGAPSEVQP